jgi:hypothetical protein
MGSCGNRKLSTNDLRILRNKPKKSEELRRAFCHRSILRATRKLEPGRRAGVITRRVQKCSLAPSLHPAGSGSVTVPRFADETSWSLRGCVIQKWWINPLYRACFQRYRSADCTAIVLPASCLPALVAVDFVHAPGVGAFWSLPYKSVDFRWLMKGRSQSRGQGRRGKAQAEGADVLSSIMNEYESPIREVTRRGCYDKGEESMNGLAGRRPFCPTPSSY